VAVTALSTTLLDAYVKDDDLARHRLTAGARDWIKVRGELRST